MHSSSLAHNWLLGVAATLGALRPCAGQGSASDSGHLLVAVSGKLVLMRPDGTQDLLADSHNSAALAPDGRHVAFTIVTPTTQTFVVMNLVNRTQREILTLPQGAHFGDIDWAPDGRAIAYQVIVSGKSDDLFLAPFPP